ncbi:MAG: pantetheine-phosphate adenylyltransferase [Elusimicrobiaceae bacterium]|nr:pantetheine-phosphate adenylyltransferase [Elusimicrobiaceae bacterium]
MIKAVYAGSFDPVTNGHLDIIARAANLFGALTVLVMKNEAKTPLFSVEERIEFLKKATAHIPGVCVETADGFTADYAHACGATVLVRGLRGAADIEPELAAAAFNKNRYPQAETVFFPTRPELQHVSSSAVKEAARAGAEVDSLVPPEVAAALKKLIKP